MEMSTEGHTEESFIVSIWGSLRNALVGCVLAMLFGFVVLLTSIYSVAGAAGIEVTPTPVASGSGVVRVVYYLPYPGLLPDSPVYKLKMLRDWVKLELTFGDLKKAEVELNFADKRLGAAQALVDGGKTSLGASTATKAENYLGSAVDRTTLLAQQGKDVKSMLGVLSKAVAKHSEVLQDMIPRLSGDDRIAVENALKSTKTLAEKVAQGLMEK